MMAALIQRGGAIARAAQQRRILILAGQVQALIKDSSVDVEDTRLVVTGKRLLHRWVRDPGLRFLGRGG